MHADPFLVLGECIKNVQNPWIKIYTFGLQKITDCSGKCIYCQKDVGSSEKFVRIILLKIINYH
jgi:hypothetical protein